MPKTTCTMPACVKPHRAKGLCSTHYNQQAQYRYEHNCAACGQTTLKDYRNKTTGQRAVCSYLCRDYLRNGPMSSAVPASHPSRLASCRVPITHPSRSRTAKPMTPCEWCGNDSRLMYCNTDCRRRAKLTRRKGREADGHTYTWTHVMRVFIQLEQRCAYCDQPTLDPEPDHVIPLSRGGSNGNANILPACKPCNSDKRDLLLHEWAEDRARRGKPPVRTYLDRSQPAFAHLLPDVFMQVA